MKLNFDSNQQYQIEAIKAVADIFKGNLCTVASLKSLLVALIILYQCLQANKK
jgi:hypothetical protein